MYRTTLTECAHDVNTVEVTIYVERISMILFTYELIRTVSENICYETKTTTRINVALEMLET